MPLTVHYLLEMQSEMLERNNVRATEIRLRPEDFDRLRVEQDFYGLTIRLADLPPNTVEFFAPEFRRHIDLSEWSILGGSGSLSYRAGFGRIPEATFTPPTERSFTFNGETFHCRIAVEPTPAVRRIQLPDVPSMEPQLRALGDAMNTLIPPVNLATLMTQRLAASLDDDLVEATVRTFEALSPKRLEPMPTFGAAPKPEPATRIDFLLEEINGGVDEPHAED